MKDDKLPQPLCLCDEDVNNNLRFWLATDHHPQLLVIGLNPSTADAYRSDPTWTKVRKIAERQGYEGVAIANLYPLRCTDPAQLPARLNPRLIEQNSDHLLGIDRSGLRAIWAAWGNGIGCRPLLASSLKRLSRFLAGVSWYHLGETTAQGNPRHPSRLAYSSRWQVFALEDYLASLD